MNAIGASAKAYETWLKNEIGPDFVAADLKEKHAKMRDGPFPFLRATYWRWAETILDICPALAAAPDVLAIGDTHLENFGTWRDAEGRLIWGANDFDDAAVMPYALDLVRLATSALLARGKGGPTAEEICEAIAKGYADGLGNPMPVVLERDHKWLRKRVLLPEPERRDYWDKFAAAAKARTSVDPGYRAKLLAAMPDASGGYRFARRRAGTGSLGRARYFAYGEWRGGPVLREAKRLVVSAWSLHFQPQARAILVEAIAGGCCRSPDPHYRLDGYVLLRRLSPNSRKLEVKETPDAFLEPDMLELMGREIANCHSADPQRVPGVSVHLRAFKKKGQLCHAAKAAAQAVAGEQEAFVRAAG